MTCPNCGGLLRFRKDTAECVDCDYVLIIDNHFKYLREKRRKMQEWEATPKEEQKEQNNPCKICKAFNQCSDGVNVLGKKRICLQD